MVDEVNLRAEKMFSVWAGRQRVRMHCCLAIDEPRDLGKVMLPFCPSISSSVKGSISALPASKVCLRTNKGLCKLVDTGS